MRIFRKIVVIVLIAASILLVTAFSLARVFEDELTQYIVGEINQQLRAEIRVENIHLSFLKKFPDASLELKDVFIASVPDYNAADFGEMNTDTLLIANRVFLRFNVWNLLKRQYLIREVLIQSGLLNVFIDNSGNANYVFWETRKKDSDRKFLLDLENVKLSDIVFRFDNRALKINARGILQKSYFKGKFYRESFSMNTGLEGVLDEYSNAGTILLQGQSISSDASLSVDPQSIKITRGNLKLAGQQMKLNGTIFRPRPLDLDLRIEGSELELKQIISHMVLLSDKYPDDLRAGGKVNFKGVIRGIISNTRMPQIQADFGLWEGWLKTSELPWDITEISTNGSYTNGIQKSLKTTELRLQGMSMRFGNSRIGGDYSISNPISPTFNYQIKTDLELSDIQNLKPIDSLFTDIRGRLLAEIRMEGKQALLENLRKEDLLNYKYKANVRLENVSMMAAFIPFKIKGFTGDAEFTDHLEISSLSGELEGSQISISGRVDNFLEYLVTPEGNLWADLDLYSERLDLNHLSSINRQPKTERDTFLLPDRLFLKTRFWFDDLEVKEFTSSNVTGNLIYKPRRLSINHIELNSMEGRIQSDGILEQRGDMNFLVKTRSGINSVNITKAFSSFNNFGQEFIVDRHLKGTLSGDVDFSAVLTPGMKINKETVLVDCDIIIKNGELSGFEPMMSLSKYIDVEELENINFSTLSNEIFIRNEEVLIPQMDIHSSAVDITASGIHGFNKEFSYKVKLALSDLLAKKSRKPDLQDSEFGVIEDDGLGRVYLYLIIDGSPDGTSVRYDRRGAVQNIREQMKEEKKELKQILNDEFGLFKKDSTLIDEQNRRDAPDFIIEWEEDSNEETIVHPDNKTRENKFTIVWDEDEAEPEDTIPEEKGKRRKKK